MKIKPAEKSPPVVFPKYFYASAIRDAVTIGVAGRIAAGEDIVDDKHRVGDIHILIAINIPGLQR